jgi:hypothetical protein
VQGYSAVLITEFQMNFDHQYQLPRIENGIEYGGLPKFVDFENLAGVIAGCGVGEFQNPAPDSVSGWLRR